MNEFLMGVGTGLATSLIVWTYAKARPFIINLLTKETRISGDWKWFDCTSTDPVGTVSIRQTGGHISGAFRRSKSSDGHTTSRTFKFSGSVYGHTLILQYYEPEDPNNVRGVIVLRVVSGRAVMFGNTMYFDSYKGRISTIKFLLSQKDNLSAVEKAHLKDKHPHPILLDAPNESAQPSTQEAHASTNHVSE